MNTVSAALRKFEKSPGFFGLMASKRICKGDSLFSLNGPFVTERTRYSLQIDAFRHIDGFDGGAPDDFTNHGCTPNAYLVFPILEVHALKDIETGEEVLINYCATEEELFEPFTCGCGSPACYGPVRGFRFLDEAQREALKDIVSPWLKNKYKL